MKIVLGISGSSYAPTSGEVFNALQQEGHKLRVIVTDSARQFLPRRLVKQALTDRGWRTASHIECASWGDAFLVAPATANSLSAAANGSASNLLQATIVAWAGTVHFFPAMNRSMWTSEATVDNVAALRGRGHEVFEPSVRWSSESGEVFEPIGYNPIAVIQKVEDLVAAIEGRGMDSVNG
ncbi:MULTISPECIES: flavoprotein [unclassified Microbacterium]|uniref:flavoprotein n=1 Tax=unclassified Microbacterium TaxID=2609290 RepID=UPI000CFE141F|nr:hypothetical protein CQ032_16315 [Microbacterium sp. MYb43]PQZ73265.1 hypothetical protein CQ031_17670 [Microbacterium sp. MYb40]PRB18715.1 hypothetical protein CQ040_16705 [Microbacterium sp. MYb54]PRB24392.1 hypothetical protein CQ037_17090 [Microbacterium sp. MYb50]PRB64440.1 hypothetical protein CQ027_20040 [Microbacterium sp. MYb32]PRB67256.1 hypothetical protein CQ021_08395 [Microbacterium sp. MYb24]